MALTAWSAYVAAAPEKANSCTQTLLVAKGVGTNQVYMVEVDQVGGGLPISGTVTTTAPGGRSPSNPFVRNDYTGTAVNTTAYVELVASTSATTNRVQIFDSSGQTMKLAFGAVGAEVDKILIFPGGLDMDLLIPSGTRVSLRAVSANATVGEISINFLS